MEINTKHDLILNYIEQIRKQGSNVVEYFNKESYHFAVILCDRFGPRAHMLYNSSIHHFAVEIDDYIYDITGDITENFRGYVYWSSHIFSDVEEAKQVQQDVMWKIPKDILTCGICGECFKDDCGNCICGRDHNPVDRDMPCDKGGRK